MLLIVIFLQGRCGNIFFSPACRLVSMGGWMTLTSPSLQGQRPLTPLSCKHFEQEVFVPAATTAFHGQAVFAGMLFEE
jgi:hypothetical protein